jgi:very-short-patch-repair endonuclease
MIRVKTVPSNFYNLTLTVQEYNSLQKKSKKLLGNYMKNETTKNFIKQIEHDSKTFEVCVLVEGQKKQTWGSLKMYEHLSTWLNRIDATPLYRKELVFAEVLINSFKDVLIIEKQYPVLSYLVDFYIPKLNIVIEFDEPHHNQQIEKDKKREEDILKYLNCQIIRQKSNEPYELTINKIIKTLIK